MDLKYRIQKFLKEKLLSKKIKLIHLARESGIPYSTLHPLSQGIKANPELRSLLRIANYFKCPLDEVTGRGAKYLLSNSSDYQFHNLSAEEINSNLKQFITLKIQQNNISIAKLSLNIGFGKDLISDFIREDRALNSLGSAAVVALADYFDISIDQMIGRSVAIPSKIQEVNHDIPKVLQSLDSKDIGTVEQIKASLTPTQQEVINNPSPTLPASTPTKKITKTKDLPSR